MSYNSRQKFNCFIDFLAVRGYVDRLKTRLQSETIDQNELNSALFSAARNDRAECVKVLLDAHADPNTRDELSNSTPLMMTTNKGAVDYLLNSKADPNAVNDKGLTALMWCGADTVNLLLEAKADPNIQELTTGRSALMRAICLRDVACDTVNALLIARANPDAQDTEAGDSALMTASRCGRSRLVRQLLESNASTNLSDKKGRTALMKAIRARSLKIVQLLLNAKAPIDQQDNLGTTAIMFAANTGQLEIITIILEKGPAVNLQDHLGETALMKSVLFSFEEVVLRERPSAPMSIPVIQSLIDHNANLFLSNNLGRTALMMAPNIVKDFLSQNRSPSPMKSETNNSPNRKTSTSVLPVIPITSGIPPTDSNYNNFNDLTSPESIMSPKLPSSDKISSSVGSGSSSTSSSFHFSFPLSKFTPLGLDIGGTLVKVTFFEEENSNNKMPQLFEYLTNPENVSFMGNNFYDKDLSFSVPNIGTFHFFHFETRRIETFVNLIVDKGWDEDLFPDSSVNRTLCATGGGANKFADLFKNKLGVKFIRRDELVSFVTGLNFMVKHCTDGCYFLSNHGDHKSRTHFCISGAVFPYLCVNIGSGVSIIRVDSENSFQRVTGTCLGGGTYWALCRLLLDCKDFDQSMKLSKTGDSNKVDMLVSDIYGRKGSMPYGLDSTTIACSLGKLVTKENPREGIHAADIARSLLNMIGVNIAQLAYLCASSNDIKYIFFAGSFLRKNDEALCSLSQSVDMFSGGKMKTLFFKHEGYLGSLATYLSQFDID